MDDGTKNLQQEFDRQLAACFAVTLYRRQDHAGLPAIEELTFQGGKYDQATRGGKPCYPLAEFQARRLRENFHEDGWAVIENVTLPDGNGPMEVWLNPQQVILATLTATDSDNVKTSERLMITVLGIMDNEQKRIGLMPIGLAARAETQALESHSGFRRFAQPDPRGIAFINPLLEDTLESFGSPLATLDSAEKEKADTEKTAKDTAPIRSLPVRLKNHAVPKSMGEREAVILPFRPRENGKTAEQP